MRRRWAVPFLLLALGVLAAALALRTPPPLPADAPPHLFSAAVGLSGRYDARAFTNGWSEDGVYFSDPLAYVWNLHGPALAEIRRHTHITLVCGQGNFEGRCLPETYRLADALRDRGIPHWRDIWGRDVSHEWHWWRRQIRYHVLQRVDR